MREKGKKGRSEENRELVGLGRFVKIPRTTYKLHRSIAGARLKSAKSLYVRSRRCSLLACSSLGDSPRSASRNSICRGTFCEARHENPLNLTSSWLNSVFSYHLVEAVARPLAVCPARPDRSRVQSCPIYKKRQQLLRSLRINIGYVSELTYRAREILSLFRSVFLLGALPLLDPPVISALIQMQLAPFCTFPGRARQNIVVPAVVPRRRKLPTSLLFSSGRSTFLNLPLLSSSRMSPLHSFYPMSRPHHFFGIRSVPVGQSCNPTGVIGFGLIHWSSVLPSLSTTSLCLLRSFFSSFIPRSTDSRGTKNCNPHSRTKESSKIWRCSKMNWSPITKCVGVTMSICYKIARFCQ